MATMLEDIKPRQRRIDMTNNATPTIKKIIPKPA